jgi:hypothetical protein
MRALKTALLVLIIGCTLALAPLHAGPKGAPVPFSADWVVLEEGQPQEQGKYYASSEGIRMESVSGGEPYIMIFNYDRKLAWNVMESERMYMETAIDPDQPGSTDDVMGGLGSFGSPCPRDAKATRIGRETLHGRNVEKWTCSMAGDETLTVWFDTRLQVPIRSEDEDGTFELKNIKESRPSADLFLPPAGYTKFAIPAGMPTGRPSGAPQGRQPESPPGPMQGAERQDPKAQEEQKGTEGVMRGVREGLRGLMGR